VNLPRHHQTENASGLPGGIQARRVNDFQIMKMDAILPTIPTKVIKNMNIIDDMSKSKIGAAAGRQK